MLGRESKASQAIRTHCHASIGVISEGDGRQWHKTNQPEVFPIDQIRRTVQIERTERRQPIQRRLIDFNFGNGCLLKEILPHFAHPQDGRDRRLRANIERL